MNTIQSMHIIFERKTYKHNPKVSPFGIALVQKKKANKVNDRFGLAFQYQIYNNIKK